MFITILWHGTCYTAGTMYAKDATAVQCTAYTLHIAADVQGKKKGLLLLLEWTRVSAALSNEGLAMR